MRNLLPFVDKERRDLQDRRFARSIMLLLACLKYLMAKGQKLEVVIIWVGRLVAEIS